MAETYAERMRRIELEDFLRRCERERKELDALMGRPLIDEYHVSRGISGEPTEKNRNYRVMPDSWTNHNYKTADGTIKNRRTRCVGGDVTVTHADGSTETRSADSFRRTRTSHKRTRTIQTSQGQSYFDRVAQLGAVGDID